MKSVKNISEVNDKLNKLILYIKIKEKEIKKQLKEIKTKIIF